MSKRPIGPAIKTKIDTPLAAAVRARRGWGFEGTLTLIDDEDIDAICPLVHAGQATAVMKVVAHPVAGMPLPGLVVTEITPSGWIALEALIGKGEP